MSKKKENTHPAYTSAKTGKRVTQEYAEKNKETTVKLQVNNPKKNKK